MIHYNYAMKEVKLITNLEIKFFANTLLKNINQGNAARFIE